MPTVLRWNGYRFYFFSNEGSEPPHIHVDKAAPPRPSSGSTTYRWRELSASRPASLPNYLIRCVASARCSWRLGVAISAIEIDPRVAGVTVTDTRLEVALRDGRTVSAPLAWFPRLASADPKARLVWEPSAAGLGIHWPLIDEDLSVEGLLRGGSLG